MLGVRVWCVFLTLVGDVDESVLRALHEGHVGIMRGGDDVLVLLACTHITEK